MIKIPISDLKKQIAPIREELDGAIKEVIDNTSFISGKQVGEFEEEAAAYCGVKFAIGVSNGTDAISLSLLALGIKQGDAVLCPAFTYYATAGAIAGIGAIPVFTDIDLLTYNMPAAELERVMKEKKGLKIKAVVPVHLYGQCADMDGILAAAGKYNLKVVEDTAQAFGAQYMPAGRYDKAKKAGTIADCGSVSFFPGKNLGAFGDAGMVLTNDSKVADNLRLLRDQGNREKYHHLIVGFNHRLDSLQAAVLKVKLKYLDSWNKKRQGNAEYFNRQLKSVKIHTPYVAPYSTHIYHQYVLRLDSSSAKLIEHLRSKGIDSRVYYPIPLHLQKCFRNLGYKKGDFPESEKASSNTLAIPVYPDLTKEELDFIIASMREFLC